MGNELATLPGSSVNSAESDDPDDISVGDTAKKRNPQSRGRPTLGRRAWIHSTTIAIVAIGLLATGLLSWATETAAERTENRLLRQRARETAVIIAGSLPGIQTPLASAAELIDATDADVGSYRRLMEPLVGPGKQFVSASVWPVDSATPLTVVGTPPLLAARPAAEIKQYFSKIGSTPMLAVKDLLNDDQPRLGYSFTAARRPVRFVAYAEGALPKNRTAVTQEDSAFADLDYALYLGRAARPSKLLISSSKDLPLRGRMSTQNVPFGDANFHMVVTADAPLGGGLLNLLPWLIALFGSLIILLFAYVAERMLRRRDHAEQLAAQLQNVAEEIAYLYAAQRGVAETLQRSLLPAKLPVVAGMEFGARYETGSTETDVGGDWYDVVRIDDDRLLLVIGDVSGHDIEAATIMASLRFAIRAYAAQGDDPCEILTKLSKVVNLEESGHFATVLCVELEIHRQRMSFASAGHPNPLLLEPRGPRFVQVPVGMPVGMSADEEYRSVTVDIAAGTTMLAFTDGLIERRGESIDVGMDRLQRVAVNEKGSLETLLTVVIDAMAGTVIEDDTAVVGVRWKS